MQGRGNPLARVRHLSFSRRRAMRVLRWSLLLVLVGGLIGGGYLYWRTDRDQDPSVGTAEATLDDRPVRITGPHSHQNLTVFLVHADAQDDADFLTLDEGLREGTVQISELEQEQVQQLHVE